MAFVNRELIGQLSSRFAGKVLGLVNSIGVVLPMINADNTAEAAAVSNAFIVWVRPSSAAAQAYQMPKQKRISKSENLSLPMIYLDYAKPYFPQKAVGNDDLLLFLDWTHL